MISLRKNIDEMNDISGVDEDDLILAENDLTEGSTNDNNKTDDGDCVTSTNTNEPSTAADVVNDQAKADSGKTSGKVTESSDKRCHESK